MNKKNMGWGIILICIAVFILCNNLSIIPDIPHVGADVIFAVILAFCGIKSLFKKDFFWFFICAGVIGCMFDNELHITEITPWILMVSCCLLGVGFNMIFKKDRITYQGPEYTDYQEYNEYSGDNASNSQAASSTARATTYSDDADVRIENTFGEKTRYITCANLRTARVENNFGSLKVYFNNSIVNEGGARLRISNCFGETIVSIPREWRVEMKESNALGQIQVFGQSSCDLNSPAVTIDASNSFGHLVINFI